MFEATDEAIARLLEDFELWARARNADEDRISRMRALYADLLRESFAMLAAAGPPRLH